MILQHALTRRQTLSILGAALAAPGLPAIGFADPIKTISLYGPPAGPSVTLAHAVASGKFSDIADSATFTAWRNPDELRAGLTSGSIQLSVVPIQAATQSPQSRLPDPIGECHDQRAAIHHQRRSGDRRYR